jgi:hypothetical protein
MRLNPEYVLNRDCTRFFRLFTCKKLSLGTDCYRPPRYTFVKFLCNNVCVCRFLTLLKTFFNSLALQSSAGYGLVVTRGFVITHNDATQSVALLWMSDQLVAETSTWQQTQPTNIHAPVGFEPMIVIGERPLGPALKTFTKLYFV